MTVDLPALGYDFSGHDAQQWAKAIGETPKKWAKNWAEALAVRADELRIPRPARGAIRRAILETMEKAK